MVIKYGRAANGSMNKGLNFINNIFWWGIPLLIVIGIINQSKTVDINIHDTYVVFRQIDFFILLSIGFALIGLIYFLLEKYGFNFSKILILIHFIVSVIPILNNFLLIGPKADRYYTNTSYAFDSAIITGVFILLGLITFGINVIIGFRKRTKG